MQTRTAYLPFAAVVSLVAASALAHDFWIRPASFRARVGEPLSVSLLVGENLRGEPRRFRQDRTVAFTVRAPEAEKPLPLECKEDADPAGAFTPKRPGLHVIAYEGKPATIELDAEKFEHYLREEGLEHIIPDRAARGESAKAGREAYARMAKSFVTVGDATDGPWNAACFQGGYEIIPLANPLASPADAAASRTLRFRVLLKGKPVEKAKVLARAEAEPEKPLSARTDARGEVELTLTKPGMWLLASIHMERAKDRTDVEWVSSWATLTFDLPPAK